jgi:adenylate cyclase
MGAPPTILIVDDEPKNVDYLEQELEGFGYSTVSASNGAEALAIVEATPPALILLDVMMPVMDGFKTCSILKAADATRFIPVIIMTALDAVEDRVRGIKAGADDFLTKPVDERELLARIETSLRLKEAMDRKVEGLRRLSDYFAKFVPSAVRNLVAQNPEAPDFAKQEQDASVLFLDITGYARLSEQLPPPTLNELIERYFSAFLDEVTERGGNINETTGDGFMATFQQPDPVQNATSATEAGLALLAATERLNCESQERPIEVHIGISSGSAFVGSTQFQGRHGSRWVFSASGRQVNVAARLAGIAQAGQILVSAVTRRRLGDRYLVESGGIRKLKNIEEEIETFRVVGRRV